LIQCGLPDHVADAVPDLQEDLDNVVGERVDIERQRSNLGNVRSQGSVDATALDTQHNPQIDRDPFDL
jgi:hypothetical protein